MEVNLSEDGEDGYAGFGADRPHFWIGTGKPLTGRLHVAFAAKNRAEVRAFYEAALAAGGIDNGAPGLRPHYHENYYGAFVLDPDGHNIEAVNHLLNRPEALQKLEAGDAFAISGLEFQSRGVVE